MENNQNNPLDVSRALAEIIQMQKNLKKNVTALYESYWNMMKILKAAKESNDADKFSLIAGYLDTIGPNTFLTGLKEELQGCSGPDAIDKITNFIDAQFKKLLEAMKAAAKTYLDSFFGKSPELDKQKDDCLAWMLPDYHDRNICAITGKAFYGPGNDADPFKGVCSDEALERYVIPCRIAGVTRAFIDSIGGNQVMKTEMDKINSKKTQRKVDRKKRWKKGK